MGDLGLPYGVDTPQVKGRKTEKKIARAEGARLHPNSGAGRIKEDASDDNRLIEIKEAGKTHTLSAKELEVSWRRAVHQNKTSVRILKFGNGITVRMTITKE